jgi:pyridoxal phosphate enzyme (YggS family)
MTLPAADRRERLRRNLMVVSEAIAAACGRAGRDLASVRLVAVTKYVDAATTRLLLELGCRDLGESRPQSLWEKAAALADVAAAPRWHLVGHLQRNKLRRTLPVLGLLHSLDSRRLLDALEAEAAAAGLVCDALVEVNLTDDPGRTGMSPDAVHDLIAVAAGMPHVRVRGLMGMAAVPDGRADSPRRDFARLRDLRDRLAAELPAAGGLPELSMGMSGDFAEAILEGATLVRIGSALFEGVA